MFSSKDGMKLLYVPAGNFLMGSKDADTSAYPDEKPQHTVFLDAFWIDQTDVTNAMYAQCVSSGTCQSPTKIYSYSRSIYYGNSEFDNYPVIYVDWNMADTYCKWAGRQLPTEAQWEKAARGTDGRIYPWGNTAPDPTLLNYNVITDSFVSNYGDTTAVWEYPSGASPYGAWDMAGNVWQWVTDWYQSGYYATLGNNASNPQGPSSGDGRVLRGGSWSSSSGVRSALRYGLNPAFTNDSIGFRCARSQ
jgi:serine/threonine-protein kinase